MSEAQRAGASDETLAALVGSHREFLAFLEARLRDRALAEDVLQEAFVKGLERGGALREAESAKAWFYRVLRNAVVDHHRKRQRTDRVLERLAGDLEEGREDPDVDAAVCRCVGRLATTLKPEYADALRRIELDGVAVKDFAAEQGITPGNASVRVFRAREALRKQVARACGTCAEHGCLDCSCGAGSGAPEDADA